MSVRPRRSVLYMPGSNARALEKARSLPADGLILDLEDAVAPDAKGLAREQVCAAVAEGGYGHREVVIRINGFDTEWGEADFEAACAAGPDAVLIPKVNGSQDVEGVSQRMDRAGGADDVGLWAMMETPLAILNAERIADAAGRTRLCAFVMGTNDIAKDTGALLKPGRRPFLGMLATCVLAARAHGIAILDGVYNDFRDAEGFAEECAAGRELGFDGKTLIHPGQIGPCNGAFGPDEDELARAREIVAVFDLPENADKGVVQVDGRMVERLHADIARRTVAMAEMIAAAEEAGR